MTQLLDLDIVDLDEDSSFPVDGPLGPGRNTVGQLVDAIGARTIDPHAATHAAGGDDQLAGCDLACSYAPTYYTPELNTIGGQLAGIDAALGEVGEGGGLGEDVFVDDGSLVVAGLGLQVTTGGETPTVTYAVTPAGQLALAGSAAGMVGLVQLDPSDRTKRLVHDVSAIATATARTVTWPDANVSLVGLLHAGVAGEIAALSAKATPVGADLLLIEDSEDSDSKKKVALEDVVALASSGAGPRAPIIWDADLDDTFDLSDADISGGVHDLSIEVVGDYYYYVTGRVGPGAPGSVTVIRVGSSIAVELTTLTGASLASAYLPDGTPTDLWIAPSWVGAPPRVVGLLWGPAGSPQTVTIVYGDAV